MRSSGLIKGRFQRTDIKENYYEAWRKQCEILPKRGRLLTKLYRVTFHKKVIVRTQNLSVWMILIQRMKSVNFFVFLQKIVNRHKIGATALICLDCSSLKYVYNKKLFYSYQMNSFHIESRSG